MYFCPHYILDFFHLKQTKKYSGLKVVFFTKIGVVCICQTCHPLLVMMRTNDAHQSRIHSLLLCSYTPDEGLGSPLSRIQSLGWCLTSHPLRVSSTVILAGRGVLSMLSGQTVASGVCHFPANEMAMT